MKVPAFKIGSGEANNHHFIDWHNGHFSVYYAREVYDDIWPVLKDQSVFISHDAYRLHNVGYDFDFVHQAVMNNKAYGHMENKFELFKQSYFDKIMSINTHETQMEYT